MRNRQLMQKRIEYLESSLINLQRMVKVGSPIKDFITEIEKDLNLIEDIKSMIESEPMSAGEINKF
jgi:hypothetical protein